MTKTEAQSVLRRMACAGSLPNHADVVLALEAAAEIMDGEDSGAAGLVADRAKLILLPAKLGLSREQQFRRGLLTTREYTGLVDNTGPCTVCGSDEPFHACEVSEQENRAT